jgi:D-glycero-alpha-D-manno-heptose-7-phosphate kinase
VSELKAIRAMVEEGQGILAGRGSLVEFGRLLHESWELKRTLSSKIAPALINDVYDRARNAGATGGKLLGAGGGGFMLLFVEPERRPAVVRALDKLLVVPFQFERAGTQIVLYEADQPNGNGGGAAPGH